MNVDSGSPEPPVERPEMKALLARAEALLAGEGSRDAKLQALCELVRSELAGYDWVGFYLVDPERARELVLGPFAGDPTEHRRIPFGQGICGQAAERRETFVVEDVSLESNYLSCGAAVKSEIVVPLFAAGELVGELDIDSHDVARFDDQDRRFCEALALRAGRLF
jgi:GAF domain-containing protein